MRSHVFNFWGVTRVADCGYNTCVANVAALLKNREVGGCEWTASSIQEEYGPLFDSKGISNVGTIGKALSYMEQATGRRRSRTFANFADARVVGDYAIFFNAAHVVYGIIESGQVVSILDGNVGRGWESWEDFVAYARTNKSLYGLDPGRVNQAFRLVKGN